LGLYWHAYTCGAVPKRFPQNAPSFFVYCVSSLVPALFSASAEDALLYAGFSIALATGNALLGVRELPKAPQAMQDERQYALEIAAALRDELDARPGADNRLRIAVRFHADDVLIKRGGELEVVGGPLVRTDEGAARAEAQGLRNRPQTMQ
jgi:hypothetical protein